MCESAWSAYINLLTDPPGQRLYARHGCLTLGKRTAHDGCMDLGRITVDH
jgi:hypothetical protein